MLSVDRLQMSQTFHVFHFKIMYMKEKLCGTAHNSGPFLSIEKNGQKTFQFLAYFFYVSDEKIQDLRYKERTMKMK